MMKKLLVATLALASFAALAQNEDWPDKAVAEIVTVQDKTIYPENVVATISDVTSNAVAAATTLATAQVVAETAETISNAVAGVQEIVNSLEGVGYIRGFVVSFGSQHISINTNTLATIVKLDKAGIDQNGDQLIDIWTHFTEDPGAFPVVRYTRSLRDAATNGWMEAVSVFDEPPLEQILVGDTLYDAYHNRIALPPEFATAFFRVFIDYVASGGDSSYLPVNNGISVDGAEPLTATFIDGTNVYKFVGGVRVEP